LELLATYLKGSFEDEFPVVSKDPVFDHIEFLKDPYVAEYPTALGILSRYVGTIRNCDGVGMTEDLSNRCELAVRLFWKSLVYNAAAKKLISIRFSDLKILDNPALDKFVQNRVSLNSMIKPLWLVKMIASCLNSTNLKFLGEFDTRYTKITAKTRSTYIRRILKVKFLILDDSDPTRTETQVLN
jgi:hypothetical protein